MKVIVQQKLDEQGLPDEFTCDVFPLGSGEWAEYLNSDGLPEKGTVIKTGMILVGKLGRGAAFDPDRLPTSLELHGDTPEELARKYPNYWVNMSFYATKEMEGTVDNAYLETIDGTLCAVVEISPPRVTDEAQDKAHVGTRSTQ